MCPPPKHPASLGWILPEVFDPDGHVLRFYTVERHARPRHARPRQATPGHARPRQATPGAGRLRALGELFARGFKTSPGAPVRGCIGH